jgi:hypothetical protein
VKEKPIEISGDGIRIKLSQAFLGSKLAYVWVAPGLGDLDSEADAGIIAEAETWGINGSCDFPFGINIGNAPPSKGDSPLRAQRGIYRLDTLWWPKGIYRFNYHAPPGEASEFGTPCDEDHDNFSWAAWGPDLHKDAFTEVRDFIHRERNGRGFSFRVLVCPDNTVIPFGDPENEW